MEVTNYLLSGMILQVFHPGGGWFVHFVVHREVQNLEYEQKEAKRQVGDTKDNDLQKECLGVSKQTLPIRVYPTSIVNPKHIRLFSHQEIPGSTMSVPTVTMDRINYLKIARYQVPW